ncbi:MAG TPA: hypothetical protein VF771_15250 [Longimicrobiaceae bacterium]
MKLRIAILLGALFCACRPGWSPAQPAQPASLVPSRDERAVLAAVVAFLGEDQPFLVVADSTFGPELDEYVRAALREDTALDARLIDQIVRDFTVRNVASTTLPPDLSPAVPVRTYHWSEIESNPGGRAEMLARFAPQTWFHRLSRPGFDARRTTAIVWRAFWCPGLCGYTGMVILRRSRSGWRVVDTVGLSIS